MTNRSVVLVGFEGAFALDLIGPWEVFAMAGPDHYFLRIATLGGGSFQSSSGARLEAHAALERVRGPIRHPADIWRRRNLRRRGRPRLPSAH